LGLLADFSEECLREEDLFMSLIIDAIRKAQQLRLKDLKETPFFKGPAPRREKGRMKRKHLWTLAAAGFCLLLILLGSLSYPLWKSHESQPIVSAANAPAQEAAKDDLQGLRKEEASFSRTEWPSLWEKYETDETWGDVLKNRKAKKKKKKKTTVSIESENDKILNPLSTEDEKPLKSAETKLEARIERRQAPSASLPDQPVQKPAPALPKQEVLAKPKNSELETGKNQTTASDVLIYFNSGVDYYHQRDYSKAIQAYQKVIELDPGYAEAYNNLGIIYQEAGDFGRALSAYQKAIEINPKYEKALNNLGVLLYLKGRYEESIQAFQKALVINPDNIESHINLGILFKKQGQVDQAIGSYQKALSLNPLHGETHYNMGLLYEQLGKIETAIGHYQNFVQMASKTHPDLVAQVKRHLNYLTMIKKDKQE
jgi:type IV pilus biogenesis/stability protein PilW